MTSIPARVLAVPTVLLLLLAPPACRPDEPVEVPQASQAEAGTDRASSDGAPEAEGRRDGPRVVFDLLEHDFGKAESGVPLKTAFAFRNTGTRPLMIEHIRASCGCTAATASSEEIPPGGEGRIDVVFDTKNRRGPTRKTIVVLTNDPDRARTVLAVKADLETVLGLDPRAVNFGNILRSETTVRRVQVIGKDARRIRILGVEPQPKARQPSKVDPVIRGLQVQVVDERDGEEGALSLDLCLGPDLEIGRFQGILGVRTDHPAFPEITLPVHGRIHGPLDFKPMRLHISRIEPGFPQSRVLTVTETSGRPVRVLEAVSEHPSLTTQILQITPDQVSITVICDGNLQRKREQALLRVRTDHPEQPSFQVPVRLIRKGAHPKPQRVRSGTARSAPEPIELSAGKPASSDADDPIDPSTP